MGKWLSLSVVGSCQRSSQGRGFRGIQYSPHVPVTLLSPFSSFLPSSLFSFLAASLPFLFLSFFPSLLFLFLFSTFSRPETSVDTVPLYFQSYEHIGFFSLPEIPSSISLWQHPSTKTSDLFQVTEGVR